MRPITCSGTSSSGISLVASRWSNGNASASSCGEQLHRQLPLREGAGLDRLEQVAAVEVGVGAGIFTASSQTVDCRPSFGRQWNFTKVDPPLCVEQPEAVHAEAFDHPQRARDGAVATSPT